MSSKPKNQTTTTTPNVPAYLQPFLNNLSSTGNTALTNLNNTLSNTDPNAFVAPFNPNQIQGQNQALGVAGGAGGYLPDALRQIQGTVNGIRGFDQMADTGAAALSSGATGNVVGGQTGRLDALSGANGIPGVAGNALASTASGDFLYGTPAFNEAVNASIRQARPGILGGFASQGGAGAVSGGLAQIGMQQAASDAFARLYDSERNRQVNSASSLGNLSIQDLSRQAQAAGAAGGLNLNQQGNNTNAAANIGQLLNSERDRQFRGALALPELAMYGPEVYNQIGGLQQAQAQNQLSAPLTAQQQLFNSIQGTLPIDSLLGQTQSQPLYTNKGAGALGGALSGAKLGGLFGPAGTAIGAIGGGLLGAFG